MARGRRQTSSSKRRHGQRVEGPENEDVASREGTRSTSLSDENLAHHDARIDPPTHQFATRMIQEEQTQKFHQASYEYQHSNNPDQSPSPVSGLPEARTRQSDPLSEANMRLYSRQIESSEGPLTRFATLGGASDPSPFYAKLEMKDMGVGLGDMETAQTRSEAAEQSTKPAQGMKRTNSATTGRITVSTGKRRRRRGDEARERTSEHEDQSPEH